MKGNNSNHQYLSNINVNDIMNEIKYNKACKIDVDSPQFNSHMKDNKSKNNEEITQNESQVSEIKKYAERATHYNEEGDSMLAGDDLKMITQLINQNEISGLRPDEIEIIQDTVKTQVQVERQVNQLDVNVERFAGTNKEKEDLRQNLNKLQDVYRKFNNKMAIQRMSCIQFDDDPKQRAKVENEERKKSEEMREKISMLAKQLDSGQNAQETNQMLVQIISDLQKQLFEQASEIKQLKQDMIDGGVTEKAEINRGFLRLEKTGGEVYKYCKTFYWTSLNIFMAYRNLGTGLVNGNYKSNMNQYLNENKDLVKKCVVKGVQQTSKFDNIKTGVKVVTNLFKAVPFVGSLICAVDNIVSVIIEATSKVQDQIELAKFEKRVKAINQVIIHKFGHEEQISSVLAKVAIKLTDLKTNIIKNPDAKTSPFTTLVQFEKSIDDIKSEAFEQIQEQKYNSRGVQLALRDIALFITFICKNWQEIISTKDQNIETIISNIIEDNSLEKLVKDKTILIQKDKSNNPQKKKKKKCNIF